MPLERRDRRDAAGVGYPRDVEDRPESGRVHVVVDVKVRDRALFLEYARGHVASLEAYGGRILFRSFDLEAVERRLAAGMRSGARVAQRPHLLGVVALRGLQTVGGDEGQGGFHQHGHRPRGLLVLPPAGWMAPRSVLASPALRAARAHVRSPAPMCPHRLAA